MSPIVTLVPKGAAVYGLWLGRGDTAVSVLLAEVTLYPELNVSAAVFRHCVPVFKQWVAVSCLPGLHQPVITREDVEKFGEEFVAYLGDLRNLLHLVEP
jgi:hypothetical protein